MTRDKIIELGKTYMQSVGYHSFNYKLIAEQLQIKNASIHYYFPSKEDLAVAVIEQDKAEFSSMATSLAGQSPVKKIDSLLNAYIQYFTEGEKLCVISTFGTSFNDVTPAIRRAASAYSVLITEWLSETFAAGREDGTFQFSGKPESLAALWMATLPGSLIVGRMQGTDQFKRVIAQLKTTLGSS